MDLETRIGNCRIGEPHERIELTRRDECRMAATHLVEQARLNILIISRDLDPMIFGHHEFTDPVGKFIRNQRAEMRILVNDSSMIIHKSNRLAEMAISFSSKIAIRKLAVSDQNYNEAWMLSDGLALLHQPIADRYEATLDCYTPRRGKESTEQFEILWANAELIPELRALKI